MRRIGKAILKVTVFDAVLAAVLFGSAGRIDLPWFWALLAVQAPLMLITTVLIDPTLDRERMKPGPGKQDGVAQWVMAVMLLAHLVIAGLDVGRFHWSGQIPLPLRATALAVYAVALAFSYWAMVTNRFFSSVIRIQSDRGHHVIDTGPYRVVRHPGYLGLIVASMAGGIVLGSWWSLLPLAVVAGVTVRRMAKEDAFLHRELAGYSTYAGVVRYKLVPGLW